MKLMAVLLLAGGLLTFFAGCSGGGYYTETQLRAQHADYDPTGHVRGTYY